MDENPLRTWVVDDILLHDNAMFHVAQTVQYLLECLCWNVLEVALYNRVSLSCDFMSLVKELLLYILTRD